MTYLAFYYWLSLGYSYYKGVLFKIDTLLYLICAWTGFVNLSRWVYVIRGIHRFPTIQYSLKLISYSLLKLTKVWELSESRGIFKDLKLLKGVLDLIWFPLLYFYEFSEVSCFLLVNLESILLLDPKVEAVC